jgi:phosphohistidine phosphatase
MHGRSARRAAAWARTALRRHRIDTLLRQIRASRARLDQLHLLQRPGTEPMKTLYLVRHAKSVWDLGFMPDRDRPLAERGERDAKKMAKRLAKRGVRPDLIVSSPAARAVTTAQALARRLGVKAKAIKIDDRLYGDGHDELVHALASLGQEARSVMLVGHNPGLADLAHHFTAGIRRMPTCAVAEFRFEGKGWADVDDLRPVRFSFDAPRRHRAET